MKIEELILKITGFQSVNCSIEITSTPLVDHEIALEHAIREGENPVHHEPASGDIRCYLKSRVV